MEALKACAKNIMKKPKNLSINIQKPLFGVWVELLLPFRKNECNLHIRWTGFTLVNITKKVSIKYENIFK